MLELLDIGMEDTVACRAAGKITEEEMAQALSAIREKIASCGKVCIYQEVVTIGGVELEAIIEKLKFLTEVGLSNIKKMAIVTDKKWMHNIIRLEDKIFKNIDMKSYSFADKDMAIAFLKNG